MPSLLFLVSALALSILVDIASAALTEAQKIKILNIFNKARRTTKIPAADMKIMEWDEDIAKEMQDYTDGCANYWQHFYNPPAFFAYRDHAKDPVGVAGWRTLRMAPYYDLYNGGCIDTPMSRKICRNPKNYEAIVYAENERVGCGMTHCFPSKGAKGWFHACAIGLVPLEVQPKYAWSPGERCSQCPEGWSYCVDGLCSKYPPTTKPTGSPVTSRPSLSPTSFPSKAPTGTRAPGARPKPPPKKKKKNRRKRRHPRRG